MLDGMTNIKASEVLKELKKYTEDLPHYSPDEVAEALEMANTELNSSYNLVKSELEPQPRNCKTCIGREEAKRFLYERIDRLNDDELYDIFSRIIDDMYNELPSVTPKRPKGKWIKYKVDIAPHPLHCSLCGFSNHHISDRYIKEFRRCPNCGAEMSGGGEDENNSGC